MTEKENEAGLHRAWIRYRGEFLLWGTELSPKKRTSCRRRVDAGEITRGGSGEARQKTTIGDEEGSKTFHKDC